MKQRFFRLGLAVFALSLLSFGNAAPPPTRFVVFHRPGPKWQKEINFRSQPGVGEHVAHYRTLQQEGKLAMGGPFLDGGGGMMITVPGLTREEVESFAQDDPAVQNGLLLTEVRQWYVAMEEDATN